jgi:mRNA-degrading endonuclease RelE of RelBE toxin-antitoxin system
MRPLAFHRHAVSYLKRMPEDRKAQVLAALESLRPLANPGDHPNVTSMQGQWHGAWRLRVGTLRVIFRIAQLCEGGEVIDVLQIGPRGDIYK